MIRGTWRRWARESLGSYLGWSHRNPVFRRYVLPAIRPLIRPLLGPLLQRMNQHVAYTYPEWIAAEEGLSRRDRREIAAHIVRLNDNPLISVVMPVYNTPEPFLRAAIASVEAQLWSHWQLCIADDASPAPHVARVLSEAAARDSRIRVQRRAATGDICAASNTALSLAEGDWVVLMKPDDLLAPTALYEVAAEIDAHPDVAVIYSDQDCIDSAGNRGSPYFKPDFDPDLLLAQNLVAHLGAYRRDLLSAIGGFREGFEGSQDHDLALRASRQCGNARVRHIPAVLYHARQRAAVVSSLTPEMQRRIDASSRAVAEHLLATGVAGARIERATCAPMFHRIVFPLPPTPPLVSIIIPTRDRAELLRACVEGLVQRTAYPAVEIIVADNGSVEAATLALFETLRVEHGVRVLPLPGPFNYSRLNNQAVAQARGEIILFLNNDTEVIAGDWLREMVSLAVRPEIGAVGARLLFADGRIQHCGDVLGFGWPMGVAGHNGLLAARDDPGPNGSYVLTRSYSAVTAACLAVRRTIFDEVGGFDEVNLAVAFNDVDLCLRIREAGYRNLLAASAELYHLESASRGEDLRPEQLQRSMAEIRHMRERWGPELDNDPYWNPNLSLIKLNGQLAYPSRREKPWLRAASADSAAVSADRRAA